MNSLYVGLDTSCYTTSLAAVDEAGEVVFDARAPLPVPPGERGLRQSEALFQHLRQAGTLLEQWRAQTAAPPVALVAASTSPRPVPGAYLPVFLAGAVLGQAMACSAGVPFFATSHQEGHLRAALRGVTEPPPRFLALHLSGGTTEVLLAERRQAGFALELLGGSTDLHAGQFLDRLGVAMGLPFPAGPALQELASTAAGREHVIPAAVQGLAASFSGPLAAAERALHKGADRAELAAGALRCLTETVGRMLQAAAAQSGLSDIVLCGGVAANRQLRDGLGRFLPGVRLIFAAPGAATDNAVGVASLGWDSVRGG